MKELNLTPESIRFLEKSTGIRVFNISLEGIFLDIYPQARETKAKINKGNISKLKRFFTVKETINERKRPLTEKENIFAKNIFIILYILQYIYYSIFVISLYGDK